MSVFILLLKRGFLNFFGDVFLLQRRFWPNFKVLMVKERQIKEAGLVWVRMRQQYVGEFD